MKVYDLEADVYFGEVTDEEAEDIDWRANDMEEDDANDEDVKTPAYVIGILGFDPKEDEDAIDSH